MFYGRLGPRLSILWTWTNEWKQTAGYMVKLTVFIHNYYVFALPSFVVCSASTMQLHTENWNWKLLREEKKLALRLCAWFFILPFPRYISDPFYQEWECECCSGMALWFNIWFNRGRSKGVFRSRHMKTKMMGHSMYVDYPVLNKILIKISPPNLMEI